MFSTGSGRRDTHVWLLTHTANQHQKGVTFKTNGKDYIFKGYYTMLATIVKLSSHTMHHNFATCNDFPSSMIPTKICITHMFSKFERNTGLHKEKGITIYMRTSQNKLNLLQHLVTPIP